jgi:rhamnose utilization protein RhaD (predicted bifunctional aldolase and dehydrogenase)
MINRWNDIDEREYLARYGDHRYGAEKDLLLQAYATVLLGADKDMTMHGGGNTSVKKTAVDNNGREKRALYVKAAGTPLNSFTPDYFVAMDLESLEGLKGAGPIDDDVMSREFRRCQLTSGDRLPSIESLMHAFIPAKFVSHSHPAAILKIVNRINGRELMKECFGDDPAVIPYAGMGYRLALASSEAALANAGCRGVVVAHHGLIVWGEDARAVYDLTIDIITAAEEFLSSKTVRTIRPGVEISEDESLKNYEAIASAVKKCLSEALLNIGAGIGAGSDKNAAGFSAGKVSLVLLNTPDVLGLIGSPDGKDIITAPPMTPDYPMFTRILPLWAEIDTDDSSEKIFSSLKIAVDDFAADYRSGLNGQGAVNVTAADLLPQVIIIPSVGAVCFGVDEASARRTADFTRQALSIRRAVFETGGVYESLPQRHIFDMQYRGYQQAKKNAQ